MLYTPLFLQTVQGLSAFTAGLFDIPLLVGLIVATSVAGPRIAKTGHYKTYPIGGAILTGASMAALGLSGVHTPAWAIILPLFVAGGGLGLFVQVALLAGQNAAPTEPPRRRDGKPELLQEPRWGVRGRALRIAARLGRRHGNPGRAHRNPRLRPGVSGDRAIRVGCSRARRSSCGRSRCRRRWCWSRRAGSRCRSTESSTVGAARVRRVRTRPKSLALHRPEC